MMKKCLIKRFLVWGLPLFLLFVVQTGLGAFAEKDGMVVCEAENYDAIRPGSTGAEFVLKTDALPGAASGGAYMDDVDDHVRYSTLPEAVTDGPRMDYVCKLEGGTYKLIVRGASNGSNSDTCHFGINGQVNGAQTDGTNNSINGIDLDNDDQWDWQTATVNGTNVVVIDNPGEYVLNIYPRENHVRIDKFILTKDQDLTIVDEEFGPEETAGAGGAPGQAWGPAPTGTEVDRIILDPDNPGQISWKAPLTSSDPEGDPNLLSVTKFDITYYIVNNPPADDDPNLSEYGTTYPGVDSPYTPASMDFDQTMFWRVDTTVVWDSNEMLDPNTYTDNGNGTYTQLVVGSDWQFSTASYQPPVVNLNDVITFVDIGADLSATVTETSYLVTSGEFELLDDDSEFPTGSDAELINIDTTTEPNNPTATLTTTDPGIYKVKLTVSDGTATAESIAQVAVYADACQAAKATGSWTQNYYDVTGIYLDPNEPDCLVDVLDFDSLAFDWLDDTTMTEPGPYTGAVTYAPKDVYNDLTKRIEAEAYFDAGICSDPPITDTTGIRITNDPNSGASGDEYSSYASANAFIAYFVNIPAAAVDEPVDVYIGYAKDTGTGNFSFGTITDTDLYGMTLDLPATGSWIEFVGAYAGQVTFDASGFKLVYMTYSTGMNVDWFAFDWPEE